MRAHEQVIAALREELTSGRVKVGERLAPERALAEQLGVSRTSVREAMRVFEALGVVRTSPGSGPSSGAVVVGEVGDSLALVLQLHMATQVLPVDDVLATRVLLEAWGVRAAAARLGGVLPDDVVELLDRMDTPEVLEGPPEAFLVLDAAFHVALARCSGNAVVHAVMGSLRTAVEAYVVADLPPADGWAGVSERLRREHRAIAGLVVAGDGEGAAAAVTAHTKGYHAGAARDRLADPRPPSAV